MIRQQQFDHHPPDLADIFGIGSDNHSIDRLVRAGGHQVPGAVNFHEAEAAGTTGRDVPGGIVTEMRYIDPGGRGGIENGRLRRDGDFDVINLQRYCF